MKFLLDSNLSHRVAQLLRDAGIDAAHVRDKNLQHSTSDEQAAILLANLLRLRNDLDKGAIVVIERSRLRVRSLPVLPPIPQQREQ